MNIKTLIKLCLVTMENLMLHTASDIDEQPVSSLLKWYTSGSGTYLTKVGMCVMQS